MEDEQDGVAQLREIFEACDVKRKSKLDADGLRLLCKKLQLEHKASLLVHHLLGCGKRTSVSFDELKDGFISLLTQVEEVVLESTFTATSGASDSEVRLESADANELAEGREVSPKFVLGEKKYGRRSRPASQADMDMVLSSDGEMDDIMSSGEDCKAYEQMSITKDQTVSDQSTPNQNSVPEHTTPDLRLAATNLDATPDGCGSPEVFPLAYTSGNGTESTESSLTLLETNPDEYLRGIWKKLNVGRDGFLNVEELAGVCEHIGMEMNDETICQLFDTLDCDRDGKISFEEFVQGMCQHSGSTPLVAPLPLAQEISAADRATPLHVNSSDHRQFGRRQPFHNLPSSFKDASATEQTDPAVKGAVVPTWESGIFSSIDPENTGYADSQSVISLWESLGLSGGCTMLKQLGFNPNLKVNLLDLTSQLEEEFMSQSNAVFALASYQHELHHLKANFEQAREERDRLRVSLSEANARATLLAQEVDEHHAKLEKASENKLVTLEKKHQEQLREALEELQREREVSSSQLSKIRQQGQQEATALRNEEGKLRLQLATLQKENQRLESELQDLSEKCQELHRLGENQQKELETVVHLKKKIADFESRQAILKDEQCQKMICELEASRKQNKEIQDNNDELSLELETLRQQLANSGRHGKRHRRSGSWLAEYSRPAAQGGGVKRRGSDGSSSEESDDDTRVAEKIRKRGAIMLSSLEGTHLAESANLNDSQREALERISAAYERTLREVEDSYRMKVAQLESQLNSQLSSQLSQPEVDSMDAAQSLITKLQDELDLKNVLTERLRGDVTTLQSHLTEQREQLEAQLKFKDEEIARTKKACEQEVEKMKEQATEQCLDCRLRSVERDTSQHKARSDLERELHMNLERHLSMVGHNQQGKTPDAVAAELTQDICTLFRSVSRGGGDASAAGFQNRLAGMVAKALATVETHLESLHIQEQERLKLNLQEEQGRRLKQEHMIENLEAELQHKHGQSTLSQEWPGSFQATVAQEADKPSRTDVLLRDLYVENARLLRSLQVSEDERRNAEHNVTRLHYKCKVLSQLLADVTRAAVNGSRVVCA
uniref:Putative myosin class ii heavy chain n=1 Tax=Ornithodoros turicata TaxID=34597 RepID=A0A2R5LIL6_9ACAR